MPSATLPPADEGGGQSPLALPGVQPLHAALVVDGVEPCDGVQALVWGGGGGWVWWLD